MARKRSYGQLCGVAQALDRLGDRWTFLIIRELLIGPSRYRDLMENLPGIGTNLLAARLRTLQREGLVARVRLPRPASVTAYALTPIGKELEPMILALARWGRRYLPSSFASVTRPAWAVLSLRSRFDPAAAKGVRTGYQFRIGEERFFARIDDGRLETGLGELPGAALTIATSPRTFAQLAAGRMDLQQALRSGQLTFEGDPAQLARLGQVFPR